MDGEYLPFVPIVLAVVTASVVCLDKIKGAIVSLRDIAELFSGPIIIGCPSGVEIPPELFGFNDYTSLRKARTSKSPIVILHTRTLSFALRKCDFVVLDCHGASFMDAKVHLRSDKNFWSALANATKSDNR